MRPSSALVVLLVAVSLEGKVIGVNELRLALMDFVVPEWMIPIFICIAQHESKFNTSFESLDGRKHGIFGIQNRLWCSPPGIGCGITCDSLRNEDLGNDVRCALQVFLETDRFLGQGWKAWDTYKFCHL
ncbi:PREDICTED: lysozyme E-like [Nicrophorus vespilloides]|uniref:lysozyme n=1 Tax=Nicrophorus vespilloides TaxID=110193 RepID=A0ABM1MUD5_NICVS|nr:PREDICTED: lysozyme E-like [Nicrophorus vespilloides]